MSSSSAQAGDPVGGTRMRCESAIAVEPIGFPSAGEAAHTALVNVARMTASWESLQISHATTPLPPPRLPASNAHAHPA